MVNYLKLQKMVFISDLNQTRGKMVAHLDVAVHKFWQVFCDL